MTIALQPAVHVASGSKLLITLVGQPLSSLPSTPLTAVISPSQGFNNIIASSRTRVRSATFSVVEIVFAASLSANTQLTLSFGTFSLPASPVPGIVEVEAAILDVLDNVFAASSQGSFPAVFSTAITGSAVGVSSSVQNAPNVTVSVLFTPPPAITLLRLSGLNFVNFAGTSGTRRLMQAGVSCTNLLYAGAGAFSVAYDPFDGDLSLKFPGGSASRINQTLPCVCEISGFRNPSAAVSSPSILVTTYDNSGAGMAMQNSIMFPAILCETGYAHGISGKTVTCFPCAKGTYNSIPGASQCSKCPPGTFSDTSAAVSLASCTPCPIATYGNMSGAYALSACSDCPPGTNSSLLGAAECAPCRAGSYAEGHRREQCELCRAGTFGQQIRASSKASCDSCPAGSFSSAGSIICTRCPPGTSSQEGSGDCQPCLAGTYSEVGGECLKCPGISYSLANGSKFLSDCTGVQVNSDGSGIAYTVGIVIVAIYIISFSLVPSLSKDPAIIMRFKLRAEVPKDYVDRERKWSKRFLNMLKGSAGPDVKKGEKKRFFEVGDCVKWETQEPYKSIVTVGTVQSTYIHDERDARFNDYIVFLELHPEFKKHIITFAKSADEPCCKWWDCCTKPAVAGPYLSDDAAVEKWWFNAEDARADVNKKADDQAKAVSAWFENVSNKGSNKVGASVKPLPVLFCNPKDSTSIQCSCLLKAAPARHARFNLLCIHFVIGRWEAMRQYNACWQLLLMSVFPALDTISDLVYILSSLFANAGLFTASIMSITLQFWVFIYLLWKKDVFKEFCKRTVDSAFLKENYLPAWATADNLFGFWFVYIPVWFIYWVIFPVVWFLVGYALFSFQLFPISRISNLWLYAFVCVSSCRVDEGLASDTFVRYRMDRMKEEKERRCFDSSDAIIMSLVQESKVEETVLEAVPQLAIQLLNTWLLGQFQDMPPFTIFSISLSVLSLANTLWRYGYWTLYQCLPVRNVPTELSLYNYKLSGVTDGNLSFAASSMHRDEAVEKKKKGGEIELSEKATQEVIAPLNEIRVVVSNTEGLMSGSAGTVHEEPADDQGHSGSDAASVSRLNVRIRQLEELEEQNKKEKQQLEEQIKKEKQQLEDEKNRRIQLEETIKRLQQQLATSGPSQSHSL